MISSTDKERTVAKLAKMYKIIPFAIFFFCELLFAQGIILYMLANVALSELKCTPVKRGAECHDEPLPLPTGKRTRCVICKKLTGHFCWGCIIELGD